MAKHVGVIIRESGETPSHSRVVRLRLNRRRDDQVDINYVRHLQTCPRTLLFFVGTRITNVSGWPPRKQASERAETEVTSQECRNSSDFFNHPRHTFMRRRIIPWGFQLSNGMQRQVVTLLFTSSM